MKNIINWKLFFILLFLSLMSIIFIFPYIITIQADTLKQIGQPIEIIFLAQMIQSLVLFSIAIFLGLLFAKIINFQLPLLEALIAKKDYKLILKQIIWKSIFLGITTSIIIFLLDPIFTAQEIGITTHQSYAPIWQKLLASFYGGITEEILLRLFLMTFLIWFGMKINRLKKPANYIIIISIFLTAVVFGLGHLPVTAAMTQITPLVVIRAVVLNGIGGIVFGWLFWKKGLESAMIAHFTADIFLLTILPLVFC